MRRKTDVHCRTCDYPLWNLPGRECPECGSPFKPSEFEFKPGSVKFCCPECNQAYYGTSVQGHLVPRAFDCVGCSKHVNMDEMTLLPAEGWDERSVARMETPWLRKGPGIVKRWFMTVGWSYVKPIELMRGVPTSTGTGPAWRFMLLTQILAGLLGIGIPVLVFGAIIALSTSAGGGAGLGILSFSGLSTFGSFVAVIILALIWGLLIHGTLRVTGGCAHSLGRTMSAVFYSSGTLAIQAVPCVGPYCFSYIVSIWWLVSAVLMVMEGQKVSGPRASLAVLWFPLGSLLLGVAAYIAMIAMMVTTSAQTMGSPGLGGPVAMAEQSSLVVGDQLLEDALTQGTWPGSPVDLLTKPGYPQEDRLDFARLVTGGQLYEVDIVPGKDGLTFSMLQGNPYYRAIEQLRAEEVPQAGSGTDERDHLRLGALVYCTPKLPIARSESIGSALWVVLAAFTITPDGAPLIHVFAADGSSSILSEEALSLELAAQDELRATLGLGPITESVEDAIEYASSLDRP